MIKEIKIFLIGLLFSSDVFSETIRYKTEYLTNKNCSYIEFTKLENLQDRKSARFEWSGDCRGGYIDGFGKLSIYSPDGSTQFTTSTYSNGLENGEGLTVFSNSLKTVTFKGIYKNGLRTRGSLNVEDKNGVVLAKYEGDYSDDSESGKGTSKFPNGDIYDGEFSDGKRTGKGLYKWSNGNTYEGDFDNGKRTGKGVFKWPDGAA